MLCYVLVWFRYAEERVSVGPFNQEIANRWRVRGGGTSLAVRGWNQPVSLICCTKLPLTDFGI